MAAAVARVGSSIMTNAPVIAKKIPGLLQSVKDKLPAASEAFDSIIKRQNRTTQDVIQAVQKSSNNGLYQEGILRNLMKAGVPSAFIADYIPQLSAMELAQIEQAYLTKSVERESAVNAAQVKVEKSPRVEVADMETCRLVNRVRRILGLSSTQDLSTLIIAFNSLTTDDIEKVEMINKLQMAR